ncbi:unnamed protein product [Effrenium voratum]|uniref:Uncharacterized protein n=1 Tax=Effrenium voratum TaxID=2562239 RepID=A0AA36I9Q1_9DINO|nr:unnamed protein product [Effrenium voratum]
MWFLTSLICVASLSFGAGYAEVRTFAVTLLLEDEDVRTAVLPYAHQDHCSCGAKEPPCRWSPEHQEYQCPGTPRLPAEAGAERATRVALEELSEGLLDLQPWRASPRQLSRQSELDLYNFAA